MAGATLLALGVGGLRPAGAQQGASGGGASLAALSTAPVPAPPDIQRFIRDATAAQKLGKALFWDMQAGSDGGTACAPCPLHAGAGNPPRHQPNPPRGGVNINSQTANTPPAAAPLPLPPPPHPHHPHPA